MAAAQDGVAATRSSADAAEAASPLVETPRLVLLVVIDQLGTAELGRIEPLFTDGFRRLIDGGAVFPRSVHEHALTETGPGHATISTGQFPRDHGIVTNWWVEAGDPEVRWAGDDDEYDKSPRKLEVPALGDWIKDRYPSAKVFSVSAKARAAIMLGGKNADAAFWWEEEKGLFETSSYYQAPEWFDRWNEPRPAAEYYGRIWEPLPLTDEAIAQLELEELDLGPLRPSFPHAFGGLRPAPVENFYDDLWGSPWLDELVAELARITVDEEGLGADRFPDLLTISFSVSDVIGHRYGPHSREYTDILLRQDRLVGRLLDHIDKEVGLDRTLVVMTADHGVVPVPEVMQRRGQPGTRLGWQTLHCLQQVGRDLAQEHGVDEWLIAGTVLAPGLSERTGLSRLELERQTASRLEACPDVERVWTSSQLTSEEAMKAPEDRDDERWLFANSYYPGRSQEFLIRFRKYLMRSRSSLTTHGTSYAYDREVPVLFFRAGIPAARRDERFATVDIAPTIAAFLDLEVPAGVDGRDLSAILIP